MIMQAHQTDPREEDERCRSEVAAALSAMKAEVESESEFEPIGPPTWNVWRGYGTLALWQLVALSMNLQPVVFKRLTAFGPEPNVADRLHPMGLVNTMEIDEKTTEPVTEKRPQRTLRTVDHQIERLPRLLELSTFAQRLALAVSWLDQDNGLRTAGQHHAAAPERTKVAPRLFLAWARHHIPLHDAMIAAFDSAADDADAAQGQEHVDGPVPTDVDSHASPAAKSTLAATASRGLTSAQLAEAFDGLGWDRAAWRAMFKRSSYAVWLKSCMTRDGARGNGGSQKEWDPIAIANALVKGRKNGGTDGSRKFGRPTYQDIRKAFNSRPLLRRFSDAWKREEDELDPIYGTD